MALYPGDSGDDFPVGAVIATGGLILFVLWLVPSPGLALSDEDEDETGDA